MAKIERIWAMPNKQTFSIKPIRELIARHITRGVWLDPFSRNSLFSKHCITNDIDTLFPADYHEEALVFLKRFPDEYADGVLFDPPYSARQISECYRGAGMSVHMKDTQGSFYGDRKNDAARALKPGGKAISFGWNSGGMGIKNGMEIIEILLVPHGGAHNDTICVVEIKGMGYGKT